LPYGEFTNNPACLTRIWKRRVRLADKLRVERPGKKIMHRIQGLALVLLLAAGTTALAQFPQQPPPANLGGGNEQERAACRPDVVKYCKAELATNQDDVFAILACLQRNRPKISSACQQVLASHGQ
jgi:hypothetical protein